MVSKKSISNIKLIEKLLNQNLKGINFFQGNLTKYKILLMVMIGHYKNYEAPIEKKIKSLNVLKKNLQKISNQCKGDNNSNCSILDNLTLIS